MNMTTRTKITPVCVIIRELAQHENNTQSTDVTEENTQNTEVTGKGKTGGKHRLEKHHDKKSTDVTDENTQNTGSDGKRKD